MDDLGNFVGLEPAKSRTAATTAWHLLTRCNPLGPPGAWLGDTVSHFRNHAVRTFDKALIGRRFVVVNSLWSHGESKRMMCDIIRILKVMMQEGRRDVDVLVGSVAAVQKASSTHIRESYTSCSCNCDAWSKCSSKNAALWCRRECGR